MKIGFFRDEELCEFGPFHRLLFQGLWLLADREGRLRDKPRTIKSDLFPFDLELDVDAMLTELALAPKPFIRRYRVGQMGLIQVVTFEQHQRPHHSEPGSELPAYQEDSETAEKGREAAPGREGKGREGKGKERGAAVSADLGATPETLRDLWNAAVTPPLPQCLELGAERRRKATARLRERQIEQWVGVIQRINDSDFCRGVNDRGWKASFDWLLQPDTATKVLEGKYDNRTSARPKSLGPAYAANDWRDECQRLHNGACGNPHFHAAKIAEAS